MIWPRRVCSNAKMVNISLVFTRNVLSLLIKVRILTAFYFAQNMGTLDLQSTASPSLLKKEG